MLCFACPAALSECFYAGLVFAVFGVCLGEMAQDELLIQSCHICLYIYYFGKAMICLGT